MQLDALTAGTTLILVQLCVSLIMAGIFYALPGERCTRYWALSGVFVAIGLAMVILNAGAPRYFVLIVGNNLLLLGIIYQWRGLRAFYRKPPGYAGWIVGVVFFICYALLLVFGASVSTRGLLASMAIFAMLLLYQFEIITGQAGKGSFASRLAIFAVSILLLAYAARLVLAATGLAETLPRTNSVLSVTLLYLTPIAGTLLLSSALLLLYFERIVADKHHLATHDELTGAMNRRAIDASGERELAVARRLGKPMAVGLIDIDHFKSVNDQFGHAAGDLVLFEVAQILKNACRNIDLVGRYGGEEFCIVFPNMDRAACETVGKRLVDAIRLYRFPIVNSVTVSVGIALLDLDQPSCDWQALTRQADQELYRAKRNGRNQFSVGLWQASEAS